MTITLNLILDTERGIEKAKSVLSATLKMMEQFAPVVEVSEPSEASETSEVSETSIPEKILPPPVVSEESAEASAPLVSQMLYGNKGLPDPYSMTAEEWQEYARVAMDRRFANLLGEDYANAEGEKLKQKREITHYFKQIALELGEESAKPTQLKPSKRVDFLESIKNIVCLGGKIQYHPF